MPTEKKPGSIKTSNDYDKVTSAVRRKIHARGGSRKEWERVVVTVELLMVWDIFCNLS